MRKKKTDRQKLVAALDKVFSLYIRQESKKKYGKCPFCKTKPIEHCFHFLSRVSYATRWNELNAIGSCRACNMSMEYSPAPFLLWFIDNRGRDKLDYLQALWHSVAKFSNSDLETMIKYYEQKLEALNENKA